MSDEGITLVFGQHTQWDTPDVDSGSTVKCVGAGAGVGSGGGGCEIKLEVTLPMVQAAMAVLPGVPYEDMHRALQAALDAHPVRLEVVGFGGPGKSDA